MPRAPETRRTRPTRRAVLGVLGTATLSLAGCLSAASSEESTPACLETGTVSLTTEGETFVVRTDDDTAQTFAFTLSNDTSCSATVGRGTWQLERLTDDEPEVVAKGDEKSGTRTLRSGDSHTWSLSLESHPTPETTGTTYVTADLPEGRFAFVVAGMVGEATRFTRSARFALVKRPGDS